MDKIGTKSRSLICYEEVDAGRGKERDTRDIIEGYNNGVVSGIWWSMK